VHEQALNEGPTKSPPKTVQWLPFQRSTRPTVSCVETNELPQT